MENVFLLIIAALVAFWAGWRLRGAFFMHIISEEPEKIIAILKQIKKINDVTEGKASEDTLKGTELRIERVGDTLYAYSLEKNEFIAQGSDLKSLLEIAHKRFPNRVFFGDIPADDPAKELV